MHIVTNCFIVSASVSESRQSNISSFCLPLRALFSRIGFNAIRPSFPRLNPPGTRAITQGDKRQVDRIFDFGRHPRALIRNLSKGGSCRAQIQSGNVLMFVAVWVVGIIFCKPFASPLRSVAAHVASRFIIEWVFTVSRCTLHFTLLLWRENRLERPSPFVRSLPWTVNACRLSSVLIPFVAPQRGRKCGGRR